MVVSFRNSCCTTAPKNTTENLWIQKGILALTSCTSFTLFSRHTKKYPPFLLRGEGHTESCAILYCQMTSNAHLLSHSHKSIVSFLILLYKIMIEKLKICSALSSGNKVHVESQHSSSTPSQKHSACFQEQQEGEVCYL